MQKKVDTVELDIPQDDIACWERYPKHRWVYDLSRLLDSQHIQWCPYETEELRYLTQNIVLYSTSNVQCSSGVIYTKTPASPMRWTEVYIAKGEIKLMRHIDPESGPVDYLDGGIELRLSAFVTMHFAKFTGVITCITNGNEIHRIQLRPYSELGQNTNSDILKLTKRIYKRTDITVSGPTDQSLHETLAS